VQRRLKENIFHRMRQNNVASNTVQKFWTNQWSVILGAGLCTTCLGERVLVVISFNATFLSLRPYCEKYVPLSGTMQKVWQHMVARFDAVRLFIFVLILWTLQLHFTLWLSARTLQCLFEGVCMPQYFRTLPGLDQGWTQYTLDVTLHEVLRVSEQQC